MAEWFVRFFDRSTGDGMTYLVGEYTLADVSAEVRNSEPGGFSGVIAIGQTNRLTNQPIPSGGSQASSFAPFRTNYQLWRRSTGSGVCISSGMVTSTNLNFNRDTILVGGKDWLHYLQRRIYPFDPELYVDGGWTQWPRQWPDLRGIYGPRDFIQNPTVAQLTGGVKIDVAVIVREIIQSMWFDPPTEIVKPPTGPMRNVQWPNGVDRTTGVPPFKQNLKETGQNTTYKIFPGDTTTIFDHITKLSEQVEKGFEFDIDPFSLEFRMWSPRKDMDTYPMYTIFPGEHEFSGQVVDFDWTNDGPDGTYLIGLGSGRHKVGRIWTDADNVELFGRLDKTYDFGEVSDPDMLIELLKDQNDLHPQRKLALTLLNPEFLSPNFYTGDRPRSLVGRRIQVQAPFLPYRQINAQFRVNAIKWAVDNSTNENVELELEMEYEPFIGV